jgi:hypothetical protein
MWLRSGLDVGAGEIRSDADCQALAAEIIAMMVSLQVRWLVDPDEIDMAAVLHHYIQSVRRAIGVRPTGATAWPRNW